MPAARPLIMVSGCLMGLGCRYDGQIIAAPDCGAELARLAAIWLPFCPEQLGGLATPRPAADLVGGDGAAVLAGRARVVTREGTDVTAAFRHGAEQVLAMARAQAVTAVFLKARSPSCGLTPAMGVTAALLARHGFRLREF